ncbi:MAG TPA: Rieske 2Fe-2S domain-containing protein [Nannocystaceae bacterium]|nr:Rieske 2Fe-2S domain-containing protein [Nannocystaceae bacterium]
MRSASLVQSERFCVPSYPRGWFAIADAHELPVGAVLPIRALGRDYVAFRGEDGVARVLAAHCPHLGAHLGHGGSVRGNKLRCPYHGWCFDGRGTCVEIPFARKIPDGARVPPHETRERAGMVFVWHDPVGGPPDFDLPEISLAASASDRAWIPQDPRTFTIHGHVQDMMENTVDSTHFVAVHELEEAPRMVPEAAGPLFHVHSTIRYPLRLGGAEGTLDTTSYGLGFATTHFRGLAETLLISAATPIDLETSVLRVWPLVRDMGEPMLVATVAAFFLTEVLRQIEADAKIWAHKVLVARPLLAEGDGPIGAYRRWTRQFYPEAP